MGRSLLKGLPVLVVLVVLVGVAVQPAFAASACSSSGSTSSGTQAGQAGSSAEIDLNTPVPNYWPLPNGCKKMVPAGGAACEGCCRTTVNTWLSPWCWQHTQPGPQRDECHDDVTNWYIWCMQDCGGATAPGNQSNP